RTRRVRGVGAAADGEVDRHPTGCRVDHAPAERARPGVVNGAVLLIAGPDLIVRARNGVLALCEDIGPGVVADERVPDPLDVVPAPAQRAPPPPRKWER